MKTIFDFQKWKKGLWHLGVCFLYINGNYALNLIRNPTVSYLRVLALSLILLFTFYWLIGIYRLICGERTRWYGVKALFITVFGFYWFAYFYIYYFLPKMGIFIFIEDSTFNSSLFLQAYVAKLLRTSAYVTFYLFAEDKAKNATRSIKEKVALIKENLQYKSQLLSAQGYVHYIRGMLQGVLTKAVLSNSKSVENELILASELMDYSDPDGKENSILIYVKKEIRKVDKFIDYLKNRYGADAVCYTKYGRPSWQKIPSLILMTLMENIFKYGIVSNQDPVIVEVSFDQDAFQFMARNRKKMDVSGIHSTKIGLENIKSQLELHLPDQYCLTFQECESYYEVVLHIK